MHTSGQMRFLLNLVYVAAIGGLCYFLFSCVIPWLLPFLLGTAVAALLRPISLRLAKRTCISERWAAILSLVLFYLAAAGILTLFLTLLLAQAYELLTKLPDLYLENLAPLLDQLGSWFYQLAAQFGAATGAGLERLSEATAEAVRQAAVDGSSHLVGWAAGLAARLPLLLLAAVFTVMISLMTAVNYKAVGAFLYAAVPESWKPRVRGLQRFARETVFHLLKAYTIIMAATFVQLAIGLWLLQFQYVLPVAAIITLLDILPLIGSGTILVPWGIVLLAGGDTPGGAGLLLLFAVIAVVRNILEPRVVGNQLGLHPIATITAMYAGLKIAGFWGLLLAPVTVLLVKYLFVDSD